MMKFMKIGGVIGSIEKDLWNYGVIITNRTSNDTKRFHLEMKHLAFPR